MRRRDRAPVEVDVPVDTLPTAVGDALTSGAADETPSTGETPIEGEGGEDQILAIHRTLDLFATVVTVVTTTSEGRVRGVMADGFVGISQRPPLMLVVIDDRAEMRALLVQGKRIGISVLSEEQEALSRRFITGPGGNTPEPTFDVVRGTPVVEDALAQLVARVTHVHGEAITRSPWDMSSTRATARGSRSCPEVVAESRCPRRRARSSVRFPRRCARSSSRRARSTCSRKATR